MDYPKIPLDYYNHKVAVVGKGNIFIKYRDALVESIKDYCVEAHAYSEIEDAMCEKPTCIVVICPGLYRVPRKKGNTVWIMIQTEQLDNGIRIHQPFLLRNLIQIKPYLKAYDVVLDGNPDNIEWIKKHTKAIVAHLPLAVLPNKKEEVGKVEKRVQQKYDLIFIGELQDENSRRRKLLEYLKTKYSVYPFSENLWGEKKNEAILSAKICLNIHVDESRYMEYLRLFDYFSNQCFVMSEPFRNPEPFVNGVDYIEFFWTDICKKIDYYLEHEDDRKRIALQGYNTAMNTDFTQKTRALVDAMILASYKKSIHKQTIWYKSFVLWAKLRLKHIITKKDLT